MALVNILSVDVLNNPSYFREPYQFEITFECLEELKDDLEWKLIYVGSATSRSYDQELDTLLVGPVPVGVNKFKFEAGAPKKEAIPEGEILGVTVILLSCSYNDNEFVRIGYYVSNELEDENEEAENEGIEVEDEEVELVDNEDDDNEADDEEKATVKAPKVSLQTEKPQPPWKIDLSKVRRNILSNKPRVTRFNIPWDDPNWTDAPPEQNEADDEDIVFGGREVPEGDEDEDVDEDEEELEGQSEEELVDEENISAQTEKQENQPISGKSAVESVAEM